jgi:hypothetical protein
LRKRGKESSKSERGVFPWIDKIYLLSPHFVFLSFSFVCTVMNQNEMKHGERRNEMEKNPFTPINILRISSEITHTSTNKLLQWKHHFFFFAKSFGERTDFKNQTGKDWLESKIFQNF